VWHSRRPRRSFCWICLGAGSAKSLPWPGNWRPIPFCAAITPLPDEQGREIEHLLIEDYVFAYWLDHAVGELRIVDLEDAS
jgi:hypothetical protein